jgi:transcription termination factor Rho
MNNRRESRSYSSGRPRRGYSQRGPHFDSDPKTNEKLKELEAEGDPLSLAERIADEISKPNSDGEINKREQINVTELQRMSRLALAEQAEQEGVENAKNLARGRIDFSYFERTCQNERHDVR